MDKTQKYQGIGCRAEVLPSATATKACEKAEAMTLSLARLTIPVGWG